MIRPITAGPALILSALLAGCTVDIDAEHEHAFGQAGESLTAVTHEIVAEGLVADLVASGLNTYGSSPSYITWADATTEARTVCSTFLTLLLEHAYGWSGSTFRTWMGTSSPTAARYHDAIVNGNGFSRIERISGAAAGDILAIEYQDDSTSTGHVAVIAGGPRLRTPTSPVVAGTVQWEVDVIDSCASNHGPTDTRVRPDAPATGGIGKGVMRLYAAEDGSIAGHTWSTYASSVYYAMPERHAVIGRLP